MAQHVLPPRLVVVRSPIVAVVTCSLATTLAQANWADDIDASQLDSDSAETAQVPTEQQAPKVRLLRFDDRPLGLQVRLGYSTTVGELGLVGEYDLHDRVNVGLGVGVNWEGAIGGAHLRLRPLVFRRASGLTAHAIIAEVGASVGRYAGSFSDNFNLDLDGNYDEPEPATIPQTVWWGQAEIGWEMRKAWGLMIRVSYGAAMTLSEPDWQWGCTSDESGTYCTGTTPSRVIEVMTVAVGYTF